MTPTLFNIAKNPSERTDCDTEDIEASCDLYAHPDYTHVRGKAELEKRWAQYGRRWSNRDLRLGRRRPAGGPRAFRRNVGAVARRSGAARDLLWFKLPVRRSSSQRHERRRDHDDGDDRGRGLGIV